jgi:DNA-binding CsgD family transcriptional regulator
VDKGLTGEMPAEARGRRRSDLIGSPAMVELISFLLTRPNGDQIAQHVVLNILGTGHSRSALISRFNPDGTFAVVGHFGIAESAMERYRLLSLWDSSPMTDAVRSGEPIILTDREQFMSRYPLLSEGDGATDSMIVWPLSLPDERVGAIQIVLAGTTDPDSLRAEIAGLAAVLALYLCLLSGAPESTDADRVALREVRSSAYRSGAPALGNGRAGRGNLTERQLRVLRLMAKGMTNAEISQEIGFSESTVRQETMVIYRHLNASGRREAVQRAGDKGMLSAQ